MLKVYYSYRVPVLQRHRMSQPRQRQQWLHKKPVNKAVKVRAVKRSALRFLLLAQKSLQHGKTCLHVAIEHDRQDVMRFLLGRWEHRPLPHVFETGPGIWNATATTLTLCSIHIVFVEVGIYHTLGYKYHHPPKNYPVDIMLINYFPVRCLVVNPCGSRKQ